MADYVLPSVVEKRVRYFDGQFLQDQDFIDEQKYQLDREHRHNRLLHGPGVVEGLVVASTTTLNQVTVSPGTAIDSDGNQLVLAQATTVDLPGPDYDDKQGIQIFISFLATASDQQTVGGSSDYTRWLERPALTALAPGSAYAGTASPVLLAAVALDSTGRVTQADNSVRTYSGLLLPGPGPDPAALRATSAGQLELAGGLTVDGNVGIGTATPAHPLHLAAGKALRIEGGDPAAYLSMGGNGALSIDAPGVVGGRFVVQDSGNVGIGTPNPKAKLEVVGTGGNDSVDLLVHGQLRSDSNVGGLWVSADRFVGGFDDDKIGFYSGKAWQLAVLPNGHVGIGTSTPAFPLHLPAGKALRIEGGDSAAYLSMGGNGALSIDAPGVVGGRFVVQDSGNVGISAANPGNILEIGGYEEHDRYLAFKVAGGNAYRSGMKMWAWKENYGYSIQNDERTTEANGLHVKVHNGDQNGTTRLFVDRNNGNVGIGTVKPTGTLHVDGGSPSTPVTALQIDVESFHTMQNAQASYFLSVRDIGGSATHFCVRGDGGVGIGTTDTSGYKLCVNGTTWVKKDLYVSGTLVLQTSAGYWRHLYPRTVDPSTIPWACFDDSGAPSDGRLKTGLRPVNGALDLVRRLQAVRYRWGEDALRYVTRDIEDSVFAGPAATDEQNRRARDDERGMAADALAGDRLGLVAQDVQAVLPELVHDDADGYKHVRYQHLTALLAEAIKEQDAVVQALSAEIAELRAEGARLRARAGRTACRRAQGRAAEGPAASRRA